MPTPFWPGSHRFLPSRLDHPRHSIQRPACCGRANPGFVAPPAGGRITTRAEGSFGLFPTPERERRATARRVSRQLNLALGASRWQAGTFPRNPAGRRPKHGLRKPQSNDPTDANRSWKLPGRLPHDALERGAGGGWRRHSRFARGVGEVRPNLLAAGLRFHSAFDSWTGGRAGLDPRVLRPVD